MLTNLIQMNEFPVRPVLPVLLQDKTTKKNIIWATSSYAHLGAAYADDTQMTTEALVGFLVRRPSALCWSLTPSH